MGDDLKYDVMIHDLQIDVETLNDGHLIMTCIPNKGSNNKKESLEMNIIVIQLEYFELCLSRKNKKTSSLANTNFRLP